MPPIPPPQPHPPHGLPPPHFTPARAPTTSDSIKPNVILDASAITFAFGKRPVLRDISLTAHPGEIVALIGPNGSGKSTLLKVLLGHLPSAGNIHWQGKPLNHWPPKSFARTVAFLPQHPTCSPGDTVLQAIKIGRFPHLGLLSLESAHDDQVARQAATSLGLEKELDQPVETLSGGQRQRVFLARCLAQQPAALILDEPDTFLDLRHTALLAGTLRHLARERALTVIFASHNLHLATALADRVILLADGQIVSEGPPRAVLTPKNIHQTYGVQATLWQDKHAWGIGIVY